MPALQLSCANLLSCQSRRRRDDECGASSAPLPARFLSPAVGRPGPPPEAACSRWLTAAWARLWLGWSPSGGAGGTGLDGCAPPTPWAATFQLAPELPPPPPAQGERLLEVSPRTPAPFPWGDAWAYASQREEQATVGGDPADPAPPPPRPTALLPAPFHSPSPAQRRTRPLLGPRALHCCHRHNQRFTAVRKLACQGAGRSLPGYGRFLHARVFESQRPKTALAALRENRPVSKTQQR